MVICFKCDVETKGHLDRLKALGAYQDYSDVIIAAVANYAILHDELHVGASVIIGDIASSITPEVPVPKAHRQIDEKTSKPHLVPGIPAVFRRESLLSAQRENGFAQLPEDVFFPGQNVPMDRWPFGQFSKLLPAKASVRALANIEITGEKGMTLNAVARKIAVDATSLGEYFAMLDHQFETQRDDALAVGFPANAENIDKSRLRYANQFVGTLNKSNILSGLLVDLKLINLTSARNATIGLTRAGWEFALLENPALDAATRTTQKFTNEERSFLIEHINRSVPAEAFAYRAILRAIIGGATTPDTLDEALHVHIPDAKKATITDAFITTQRSGVISRMADLGLLTRARDGVRVSYIPTETGKAFAERTAAA